MTYELGASIPPRSATLAYEDVGPGLYPGEVHLLLGDHHVAVGAERRWLPNGTGVEIYAWARWIDGDGATFTTDDGEHAEVEHRHQASAAWYEAHGGVEAVSRRFMLCVIGEEDGTALGLSPEVIANLNLRRALDALMVPKVADAAALLAN